MDDDCVNKEFYALKAVEEEEIPAEAFTEALGSVVLVFSVASGA